MTANRMALIFALPFLLLPAIFGSAAGAQSLDDLGQMSIDDLAKVNVTSVSKSDEALADAPAAIYVISREDILQSGATTLPEMLRTRAQSASLSD